MNSSKPKMNLIEESELIKKIFASKDHFEVLGVTEYAQEKDIRKAYKKLALLLHPDKNIAPGAEEAFKRVGMAYEVLTDFRQRREYLERSKADAQRAVFNEYRMPSATYEHSENQEDPDEPYWKEFFMFVGMSTYIYLGVLFLTRFRRNH